MSDELRGKVVSSAVGKTSEVESARLVASRIVVPQDVKPGGIDLNPDNLDIEIRKRNLSSPTLTIYDGQLFRYPEFPGIYLPDFKD